MSEFDITVPHISRVYDYWLGGKDNISQVLLHVPHNARTVIIQARQVGYSKIETFSVRTVCGTYMGVMSESFAGRS